MTLRALPPLLVAATFLLGLPALAQSPGAAGVPAPVSADRLGGAREIIVLHSPTEGGLVGGESPFSATEAVLNHLGLVASYHDVATGLPDPALSARARGVLSLITGAGVPDPAALADWLRAQQALDHPVVLLGGAGFLQEDAGGSTVPREVWEPVLAGIGVTPGGPSTGAAGEGGLTWLPSTWPAFEAPRAAIGPYFNSVRHLDPSAEAPLRVRDPRGEIGDAVVVGEHGAFVADRLLVLEQTPITFRLRWRLDPFRLFGRGFRTQGLPALDPTTVNGRRVFFAHIDGDGFLNKSITPNPRLSAEVVRDEVLARTWLPTTVSIIAREVSGKPANEAIARSIFRLPGVEAGVHSWNHPHDWERGLLTPPNVTGDDASGPGGRKVRLDPRLEVDAAVAYVQRLLPADKRTALVQWSGKANPTAPFLARAEAIGVANMNGGDATLQPGSPSVAAISPFGRRVGPHLQVYTAAANENIYTHLWNGPFDGQKRVLDYFRFTGAPRRLAAVNIYYHFYAAERLAGLAVLKDLYGWAERMPLAHLTASAYARTVAGFFAARLIPDGPEAWRVADAGACRSVRLDGERRRVDLDASEGVAGYLISGERTWVHLAGPNARIVLAAAPPERPRLIEASAVLADWRRTDRAIVATFEAAAPARILLGGLPAGGPISLGKEFTGPTTVGRDGRIALTCGRGRHKLEVHW